MTYGLDNSISTGWAFIRNFTSFSTWIYSINYNSLNVRMPRTTYLVCTWEVLSFFLLCWKRARIGELVDRFYCLSSVTNNNLCLVYFEFAEKTSNNNGWSRVRHPHIMQFLRLKSFFSLKSTMKRIYWHLTTAKLTQQNFCCVSLELQKKGYPRGKDSRTRALVILITFRKGQRNVKF